MVENHWHEAVESGLAKNIGLQGSGDEQELAGKQDPFLWEISRWGQSRLRLTLGICDDSAEGACAALPCLIRAIFYLIVNYSFPNEIFSTFPLLSLVIRKILFQCCYWVLFPPPL